LFASVTFAVTATASSGGTISPSGAVSVAYSNSQGFAIAPNTGYDIANVLADEVSQGAVSSYTFSNVTNAHSISASFVRITNIITATAGTGGSISPSGAVAVAYDGSQAFVISSNAGYRLVNVVVDGLSQGVVTSYTFYNVTAPCGISATFALITNTITASSGAGGTISPSGAVKVAYGGSQTFNISSNTGYCISNVLVDGISVGAVASYAFTNVTYNRTIAAFFGPSPDADSDGMNDSWESLYFLSTNALNGGPDEDRDGDGMSNLKEYIAGTDPTNDASSLAVDILSFGASIEVGVNTLLTSSNYYGTSTRHYKIEEASDLADAWTNSAGYADFPATGQERILTNGDPVPRCFYRVKAWLVQ